MSKNSRSLYWANNNRKLAQVAARAVDAGELAFRCPLFGNVQSLQPLHLSKGTEYWPFDYRGYRYYISRGYIPRWGCFFWTLGLIINLDGREKWKMITMMQEDFHTFIDFTVEGEFRAIVSENEFINGS